MLPLMLLLVGLVFGTQVWVVERERGALAVLQGGRVFEIEGLGDLSHATLKFKGSSAYLVGRDGYISLIDTKELRLVRRVRAGSSSIGFAFCGEKIVVANYDPGTVLILSPDLRVQKVIKTGSRNVGLRSWKGLFVFSLMDKEEIWVADCGGKVLKKFKTSSTPFDALLSEGVYLVGLFNPPKIGVLDLTTMTYREVPLGKSEEAVLKVPHLGTWGVKEGRAYIPAVGERKLYVFDLVKLKKVGEIELPGLPVFAVVSPEGRYVAVNFSGDMEDFVALIERGRVVRLERVGRRVLHLRFSKEGRFLYVSSYYENKVKKLSIPDLKVVEEVVVPTPSGVFLGG